MRLFKHPLSTRRLLQLGLVITGAVAGAVFGVVLTRLGKLATGAPPATLANYAWNAAVVGTLAAVVSPLVTWTELRRAPLWRDGVRTTNLVWKDTAMIPVGQTVDLLIDASNPGA